MQSVEGLRSKTAVPKEEGICLWMRHRLLPESFQPASVLTDFGFAAKSCKPIPRNKSLHIYPSGSVLWRTPDESTPRHRATEHSEPFKSHITALVFSNTPRAFISFKEKSKSISWPAEDPGSSHSYCLCLSHPGLLPAP